MIQISRPSTYRALNRRTVAEIQKKVIEQSGQHRVSRFLHARNDKDTIAAWKPDLNRMLHILNVCSVRSFLAVANRPPFRQSWP